MTHKYTNIDSMASHMVPTIRLRSSVVTHIAIGCALLIVACLFAGCEPSSTASIPNSSNEVAPKRNGAEVTAPATPSPSAVTSPDSIEIEKITWVDIDLPRMEADVRFRPFMLTDRVKELDGRRVSISGYMHGGVSQIRGIQEFILLRQKECKFGPGGQADHLVQIFLQDGVTASYTSDAVVVEGTLRIKPFHGGDGFTWAIYELAGTSAR